MADRKSPVGSWGFSESHMFQESFIKNLKIFSDLGSKLERFISVKKDNPLSSPYGKSDRPCTGDLVGLWHCHLRDDAILIYILKNRCIHLICIVSHADIEGKRLKSTTSRIRNAGELPESLSEAIIAAVVID